MNKRKYGVLDYIICSIFTKMLDCYYSSFCAASFKDLMEDLRPVCEKEYRALTNAYTGDVDFLNEIVESLKEMDVYNAMLDLSDDIIKGYCKTLGREAEYVRFLQIRYWPVFHQMIDYIMFYLSDQGIIPDIGKLRLMSEYSLPDKDNLYKLASMFDYGGWTFRFEYVIKLFSYSGWKIEIMTYNDREESFKVYGKVYNDRTEECEWKHYKIQANEYLTLYLFKSDDKYTFDEICDIFSFVGEGTYWGIKDDYEVIVGYPIVFSESSFRTGNIEYYKVLFPNCALKAWCYKIKKNFIIPRIEMKG